MPAPKNLKPNWWTPPSGMYTDTYSNGPTKPVKPTRMPKPNTSANQMFSDYDPNGPTTYTPDDRWRGTNAWYAPDIRNLPKAGLPSAYMDWAANAVNNAMDWSADRINNAWARFVGQQGLDNPYPLSGTTPAAPPTFNTSNEPPRGAFDLPVSPNITDRSAWQRSMQTWWMPPSVIGPPQSQSYMPVPETYAVESPYGIEDNFPNEMFVVPEELRRTVGPAPEYTNYSLGRYGEGEVGEESRYYGYGTGGPQDAASNPYSKYFDRIVINGRTYSVPNQMLTFAKDYPWETTSWWYEPPQNFTGSSEWKDIRTDFSKEGASTDDSPPGDDGGGGGGGYGGWGWGGGYGSSNYDSKPAYPTQGYRQDPNIYYQQLAKWVI